MGNQQSHTHERGGRRRRPGEDKGDKAGTTRKNFQRVEGKVEDGDAHKSLRGDGDEDEEDEAGTSYEHFRLDESEGHGAGTTEYLQSVSQITDGHAEAEMDSNTKLDQTLDEPHKPLDTVKSEARFAHLRDTRGFLWWSRPGHVNADEKEKGIQTRGRGASSHMRQSQLNSGLCKFCRVFFDTWSDVCEAWNNDFKIRKLTTTHYDTIDQIESSRRQGCELCRIFTSIFNSKLKGRRTLKGLMSLKRLSDDRDGWGLSLETDPAGIWSNVEVSLLPHLSTGVEDAKGSCLRNPIEYRPKNGQGVELRLGCLENSLFLARHWLEDCRTRHKTCQNNAQGKKPTRLIRIDDNKIQLCLTAQREDCSMYATLSHCWGKQDFLKVTKSNYSDFLDEIPYADLSKTFRDAIDIARALGFSWIWIDSICIIQDDRDDWQRESVLMSSVYGFSDLNIAATAAPDGTKGCLFDRGSTLPQGGHVEVRRDDKVQILDFVTDPGFYNHILRAPLTNRAWVLQERLLAPRTLHFTASQLFWECEERCACETFPDQIDRRAGQPGHVSESTQELWKSWRDIVELYSRSQLTFSSDKLVAISGIARQMGQRVGDDYFAGHWRKGLEPSLCWVIHVCGDPVIQSNDVKVPSWSWAAVDEEVYMDRSQTLCCYISVLDIHVVTKDGDPFSAVEQGTLTISSKYLLRVPAKTELRIYLESVFGVTVSVYKFWDYGEHRDNAILFLPISFEKLALLDIFQVSGLLLKETDVKNGQYERVGMFRLRHDHEVESYEDEDEFLKSFEGSLKRIRENIAPMETEYVSVDTDKDGVKNYTITIV